MTGNELIEAAKLLRQLADRFEWMANGRIESSYVELNKVRILAQLVAKLIKDWL